MNIATTVQDARRACVEEAGAQHYILRSPVLSVSVDDEVPGELEDIREYPDKCLPSAREVKGIYLHALRIMEENGLEGQVRVHFSEGIEIFRDFAEKMEALRHGSDMADDFAEYDVILLTEPF